MLSSTYMKIVTQVRDRPEMTSPLINLGPFPLFVIILLALGSMIMKSTCNTIIRTF